MQDAFDPIPFDRLLAVDLRKLPQNQMDALSGEAMRRGCPLSELLGALIEEVSRRILNPTNHNSQAA